MVEPVFKFRWTWLHVLLLFPKHPGSQSYYQDQKCLLPWLNHLLYIKWEKEKKAVSQNPGEHLYSRLLTERRAGRPGRCVLLTLRGRDFSRAVATENSNIRTGKPPVDRVKCRPLCPGRAFSMEKWGERQMAASWRTNNQWEGEDNWEVREERAGKR